MEDDNTSEPQGSEGDDVDDVARPPRRPRRSRPLWRKGWFWVGVIVAEVAVVLVLSFVFERSATEVDLAGVDTTAFCDQVRGFRDENLQATERAAAGDSVGDPTAFENERDAYLTLAAIAPPALVADLEQLARLDDEIIVVVLEIADRKAADASYSGINDLTAELERASVEGKVAASRVNLVLREQCQLEVSTGSAGATVPEAPVSPGTSVP